jgi:hypothetical protein
MKTEHKESLTEFLDLMSKIKYFTKLKPDHKNSNLFKTELKIASYNELNLLVSDLLKVSIAALKSDTAHSSASGTGINVLLLLELALQLLPDAEVELLDELHRLYLKLEVEK